MLSIIHWISAARRLSESQKTIHMMGGRKGCNEMMLAQHEMIELECEYYREKSIDLFFLSLLLSVAGGLLYFVFFVVPSLR